MGPSDLAKPDPTKTFGRYRTAVWSAD